MFRLIGWQWLRVQMDESTLVYVLLDIYHLPMSYQLKFLLWKQKPMMRARAVDEVNGDRSQDF